MYFFSCAFVHLNTASYRKYPHKYIPRGLLCDISLFPFYRAIVPQQVHARYRSNKEKLS